MRRAEWGRIPGRGVAAAEKIPHLPRKIAQNAPDASIRLQKLARFLALLSAFALLTGCTQSGGTAESTSLWGEAWDFILYVVLAALVLITYRVARFVALLVRGLLMKISSVIHLPFSWRVVSGLLRLAVVAAAVAACIRYRPAVEDIIGSLFHVESFQEISSQFSQGGSRFLPNVLLKTLFMQLVMSLAYIIPIVVFNCCCAFARMFLCRRPQGEERNAFIGFFASMITVLAINTIVVCSGLTFPEMILSLMEKVDLDAGVGTFLRYLALCVALLYFAIRDLMSSDILLSIVGVNLSAALLNTQLTPASRTVMIALAVALGLIASLLRRKPSEDAQEDDPEEDVQAWMAGVVLAAVVVVSLLLLWLLGMIFPTAF